MHLPHARPRYRRTSRPSPFTALACARDLRCTSRDCSPPYTVATTVFRSPARPARKMGDLYRQVSWLAARAPYDRPSRGRHRRRQWHAVVEGSPLTVAGAAAAWAGLEIQSRRSRTAGTAFPFHPQSGWTAETDTRSSSAATSSESMRDRILVVDSRWTARRGHGEHHSLRPASTRAAASSGSSSPASTASAIASVAGSPWRMRSAMISAAARATR